MHAQVRHKGKSNTTTQHLLISLQIQCRWWNRTKNALAIEITSREYYDCRECARYDPSTDGVPTSMNSCFQAKTIWKCMFSVIHKLRDKMPQFVEIEISFLFLTSEINQFVELERLGIKKNNGMRNFHERYFISLVHCILYLPMHLRKTKIAMLRFKQGSHIVLKCLVQRQHCIIWKKIETES